MSLPDLLCTAIQRELESVSHEALRKASEALTSCYRGKGHSIKLTQEQRLAYLAVRMPATFAVIKKVLQESHLPIDSIHTLLDLGAGPGTVLWAANEFFSLRSSVLFEKDAALLELGRRLSTFPQAQWIQGDFERDELPVKADLVTFSYSLGELPEASQIPTALKAWKASQQALVIIEPGTPKGYQVIRRVRQALIDAGAFLAAPCPHRMACPISGDDWCHFAVRLQRDEAHRLIKGVELPYEDEKFSYVVAVKDPLPIPEGRILRHPQHRSGHIHFTVCYENGAIENKTLSRRAGEKYTQAKKWEWGDPFESREKN